MDDASGGNAQAFMQLLSGLPAGDYYLAIAFAGMEPLDGGGNPIFDTFGSGALSSPQPLASWFGSPFAIDPGIVGDYQLGVQSVDEPATPLLAALAFGVAAGMRRRRASVR
jgi:MYXO-CTERM domain-containing protein